MCDFCLFKWPIKCENPSLFAFLNPCNNYLLVTRRRACMQKQLSALAHAVGATVTLPDSAPSARKGSAPSAARSPAQVAATRATPAVISPRLRARPHSGVVSRATLQIEKGAMYPASVSPPVSWKSAAWQHQQQQQKQREVGTRIMRHARALPVASPSLYAPPAPTSLRHVTPVPPVLVYSGGGEKLEEAEVEENKGRSRRPWRVH